MSVRVYVAGVRETDGKLSDMVSLKNLCDQHKITYPDELHEYFRGTDALSVENDEDVIRIATEVDLEDGLKIPGLISGRAEYGIGMHIDLSKLPDDIKFLRVYMS